MEEIEDLSLTQFKIVFNNEILQINYDKSFKEYQTQTIDSVIQKVLNKIGPKPLEKTSKDFILFCSCGRPFKSDKLLSQAKCSHYLESDFDERKNKNEKFILYEKEKEEKYDQYMSNYEIGSILKEVTGARELRVIKGVVPNDNYSFDISVNLRNKIKEYHTKKERGKKIMDHSYSLKYNEHIYNELLEIGIQNNKIKAALRICDNIKEEAFLLATDESINWEDKEYLFYDNTEVMSNNEFKRLCREEVKKEFPSIIDEEELLNMVTYVINQVTKNGQSNNINNCDLINDSESSEEKKDSSDSDSILDYSSSNI